MPRKPSRTIQEKLEDTFFDLPLKDQERMLHTFATLHRMKQRVVAEKLADVVIGGARGSLIDEPAIETAISKMDNDDELIF